MGPTCVPTVQSKRGCCCFLQPRSMIGIGVIIRDQKGSIVAVMSKCLPLPLGPLEVEAKAIDEAALFAWEVGIRDIILKTDSCTAWHALQDPSVASISISNIIFGICLRLHDFHSFDSLHVRRQTNKPAHTLAAYAKNIDSFVTWIKDCPSFIESLVIQDALLFPLVK